MRKRALVILGVLIVVLGLVGIVEATSQAAPPAGAKVKAVVQAARTGNNITYSIYLVNESSVAAKALYLAGRLPSGVKFNVASSSVKGSTPGAIQGDVVAWLVNEVPAKGTAGPFTYKVSATEGNIEPVNAWVRWTSPSEGTAVSNLATAEYELAKMRSIAIWDGEIYPNRKSQITLSNGYGYNDSNKIITSGSDAVGTGEYAYLQGAATDSSHEEITSWSWAFVQKPFGSGASLEGANTQKPRFLADVTGKYVVQVTVTNAKGATSSSSMTVNAGKYAGVSLCASCHDGSVAQDMVTDWAQTGHATKVDVTFGSYSATSDYCIKCHSLGFNETANNGGMDDQARAAGWNPANGSFLAWVKNGGKTLNDIKSDSGMASTINIQCENCHGPGGSSHTGSLTYDPGSCNQCHPQGQQWQYSNHSKVDDHMSGNPSCAKCHTGQGFVEVQIRGNEAVFPDAATLAKPANMDPQELQMGQTCATCHDPHAATYPFESGGATKSLQLRFQGEVTAPMGYKVDAHVSGICIKCHANNRTPANLKDFVAGNRTRGTHENTQADVYYGQGAVDFGQKLTNSAHTTVVTEGCVQCHMAPNPVMAPGADGQTGTRDDVKSLSAGGHSFNMAGPYEDKEVQNTAACKSCHGALESFNIKAKGDYDGDGTIEGVQSEVEGLLALVEELLPKDPATGHVLESTWSAKNSTTVQRQAAWNYSLVKIDGSKGIHNTSFAVQLLQKSYKALTGKDVPGATLR